MTARFAILAALIGAGAPLALTFVARANADSGERPRTIFPYPIHETVLDNGLRVASVPMNTPGILAFYVVVRAGSRNEVEPGHSGFAHFFEHMMFRGTERFPAGKYNEVLKGLGADANAFTSDDWTCYHITAAASSLETVMDLEADRFMNLTYSVEAFQKEAGAVLGEYNKNYSMPMMTLFERARDTAYARHTYKHTTMGFLKDIEAMPKQYEYSRTFFARWYRPDNCALVVAGDIQPDAVVELAKKYWGGWVKGAADIRPQPEPEQTQGKDAHIPWKNPTLPHLLIAHHVPAFDPDSVEGRALDVLAQAAFSETSPLYQRLVLDQQWVESLSGTLPDRRDPTLFSVLARVKDAARVADVRKEIESTLDQLAREPLPPARIEAVKSHLRYRFLGSLDTPDRVAVTVGSYFQLTGQTTSIDRAFTAMAQVTAADVRRVAALYFRPANRTVVTLAHERDPR